MRTLSFSALAIVLATITATSGVAQAPDSLSFQGFLTRTDGTPLDSTGVSMTFKLYKNGTAVWTETQVVDVEKGSYDVYLGAVTPLDTVAFNQPIELGITIDGDPPEMTPRTPLVSTAYALATRGLYAFDATNQFGDTVTNLVGGADNNYVSSNVVGATIGGGGGTVQDFPVPNNVTADWGTVGGGDSNSAGGAASTVAGGSGNSANGFNSAVGGGQQNTASGGISQVGGGVLNTASGGYSTVGGGRLNAASGDSSTVAGGAHNMATGIGSTVGGGQGNTASGTESTVSGGQGNSASSTWDVVAGGWNNVASGSRSFVGGGSSNNATNDWALVSGGASNTADGSASAIAGGVFNTTSQYAATVAGGLQNTAAGQMSFAAGTCSAAMHDGSFVWQDETPEISPCDTLESTGPHQFLARASGGFYFFTGPAPNVAAGTRLPSGSGTWTSLSSESSKTGLNDVDVQSYLDRVSALKIKEWSYKSEQGVTHVGPMAEDFYAAFGLGPTEKGISGVDGDGVALAAIQGLYRLVKEQQAEIERMREEIERMRAGLE